MTVSFSTVRLAAIVAVLALATGAYVVLPGAGYAFFTVVLLALVTSPRWRAAPASITGAPLVAGAALFNAVVLLYAAWFGSPARSAIELAFASALFVLAFGVARLWIEEGSQRSGKLFDVLAFLGLLVLACGQVMGLLGWLPHADAAAERSLDDAVLFRPGGFLNPNMTAAVALLLLLTLVPHRRQQLTLWVLAALPLAAGIVAVTQSRAALLALLLYAPWVLRARPGLLAALVIAAGTSSWLAGYWDEGGVLNEVFRAFASRLSGDESSSERAWLASEAFSRLQDTPWLGRGSGYLTARLGLGSHNQLLELALSYGLIGASLIVLASLLMLWPASGPFILMGVLPTFVFSHSFYESAPFQAALGLALAADRHAWRATDSTP